MVVVNNDVDNSSSCPSGVSNHEVLVSQLHKVSKMKKEKLLTLPERIVEKDGTMNMINKPGWIWFNPFDYSNLLQMKWFSFLFIFALLYFITFLIFGTFYYALEAATEDDAAENSTAISYRCIYGVKNITTAFLFAVETSQTIGYGTRYPHHTCPVGILLILINIFCATFISTIFIGIFLLKFAGHTSTGKVRFSTYALISKRNGSLYFMFRVADPVESGMDYGAEVTAIYVDNRAQEYQDTSHFNLIPIQYIPVGFQIDGSNNQVPLLWPTVVSHKIDKNSPLYMVGQDQLRSSRMEIIITVRGNRSESGGIIDSMTSYTSKEIIWGARFCSDRVLERKGMTNTARFNQNDIDKYTWDKTPVFSAEEADKKLENEMKNCDVDRIDNIID